MRRTLTVFVALVISAPALPAEDNTLWGCAQGERRNVLYLADRGAASYVKVGRQRVPATVSDGEDGRRWTFGRNHISLQADGLADYYEDDVLKGRFRCRKMQ